MIKSDDVVHVTAKVKMVDVNTDTELDLLVVPIDSPEDKPNSFWVNSKYIKTSSFPFSSTSFAGNEPTKTERLWLPSETPKHQSRCNVFDLINYFDVPVGGI